MKNRDHGLFWEPIAGPPLTFPLTAHDARNKGRHPYEARKRFCRGRIITKQVSESAILSAGTKDAKMTEQRMEWIKRRAYSLWEEAGRPHGRDQEHWNQAVAERETLERTKASSDGKDVLIKLFNFKSAANEVRKTLPSRKSARGS